MINPPVPRVFTTRFGLVWRQGARRDDPLSMTVTVAGEPLGEGDQKTRLPWARISFRASVQ